MRRAKREGQRNCLHYNGNHHANAKHRILLQIATAIAANGEWTKSTTIRVLFDNGSQQSYITDTLRSKLQLKSEQVWRVQLQKAELQCGEFAASNVRRRRSDYIRSLDFSCYLFAFTRKSVYELCALGWAGIGRRTVQSRRIYWFTDRFALLLELCDRDYEKVRRRSNRRRQQAWLVVIRPNQWNSWQKFRHALEFDCW